MKDKKRKIDILWSIHDVIKIIVDACITLSILLLLFAIHEIRVSSDTPEVPPPPPEELQWQQTSQTDSAEQAASPPPETHDPNLTPEEEEIWNALQGVK